MRQGIPLLAEDHGLGRDAVYARRLARTNWFEHDRQHGRQLRQGKNLFIGSRDAYSDAEMIGLLVDQRHCYRPGCFPRVSCTGQVSHVGHYTQIICPSSRRVGCAVASNRGSNFLVRRHFPAGNVAGISLP